ncbi:hypothetical protein [Corallococcus terminator]|nr:hypothetical protein [Corallococcus terminator]
MMQTVLFALLSVLLRSANSVFDRWSYGLRNQSILVLNFANNFLPFVLLAVLLLVTGGESSAWALFADPRLALFALSIQAVGFAFSAGFRNLPVAKVNIASRVGDVLIPIALMLCGRTVRGSEYLFALAVSACSLLAIRPGKEGEPRTVVRYAVIITSAVIIQSLCGELFFQQEQSPELLKSLGVTTAIMFWRSAFCLLLLVAFRPSLARLAQVRALFADGPARLNLLLRSAFTVGSQITFVLALATGQRVIAWPILNSVTLFSMVFASTFIQEHPERREVFAMVAVVSLALLKAAL